LVPVVGCGISARLAEGSERSDEDASALSRHEEGPPPAPHRSGDAQRFRDRRRDLRSAASLSQLAGLERGGRRVAHRAVDRRDLAQERVLARDRDRGDALVRHRGRHGARRVKRVQQKQIGRAGVTTLGELSQRRDERACFDPLRGKAGGAAFVCASPVASATSNRRRPRPHGRARRRRAQEEK